jgi:hypothetical protein
MGALGVTDSDEILVGVAGTEMPFPASGLTCFFECVQAECHLFLPQYWVQPASTVVAVAVTYLASSEAR